MSARAYGSAVGCNWMCGAVARLADVERAAGKEPQRETPPPSAETEPRRKSVKIRRIVGRKMVESWTQAPHFFVTVAVDMTDVIRFRRDLSVSINSFILMALARSLHEHPWVNSHWIDGAAAEHSPIPALEALELRAIRGVEPAKLPGSGIGGQEPRLELVERQRLALRQRHEAVVVRRGKVVAVDVERVVRVALGVSAAGAAVDAVGRDLQDARAALRGGAAEALRKQRVDLDRPLDVGGDALVQAPWIALLPGLAVVAAVVACNLVGDGLRDVMDPTVNIT